MSHDPDCRCLADRPPALTRRRFVGAATGALAASPALVAAQATPEQTQPEATPAASLEIDLDALYAVSQLLVGTGELNEDYTETLGLLLSADEARVEGFRELRGNADPTSPESLEAMSDNARTVVNDILSFWYTGYFDGNPVENRAEIVMGLPVWGTLPYFTQPALCKSFAYWANDVEIDS